MIRKKVILILLGTYWCFVLVISLWKNFDVDTYQFGQRNNTKNNYSTQRSVNLRPFNTINYYISGKEKFSAGLLNIGGNILLFIPFGILLTHICSSRNGFLQLILFTGLASSLIEALQYLIRSGDCDIDDVILNIVGGVIGWLTIKPRNVRKQIP